MEKFMESLLDYLEYLEAKGGILPGLFLIGSVLMILALTVVFGVLVVIKLGLWALISILIGIWFVTFVYMFYKFRKEKRAKT